MLGLDRRGRIWRAIGQVNGCRVNQSLRTRDRVVAQALLRDLELQLLSGGRVRRLLWPDFENEFLEWVALRVKPSSLRRYRFVVNRFGQFFSARPGAAICDVTPHVLTDYFESRRRDRHPTRRHFVGLGGLRADIKVLRAMFQHAVTLGYLAANPVLSLKASGPHRETQPFSEDELRRMLGVAGVQMRAVLLTFLFTGLRISDVIGLRKDSVDLAAGTIRMHTQKRGKVVTLGIHPELRGALQGHFAQQNEKQAASEFVFSTAAGSPMTNNLDRALRRLWKRAGVDQGHAHRFRDTFAVRLLANGASLYDVAKLLGTTVAVAERHYAPYVKELQERATRLVSLLTVPGGGIT